MSLDLSPIAHAVLSNSVAIGVIQKFIVDLLKKQLSSLDESGQVVKYKGYVQPIVFVLTAFTGILSSAVEGHAGSTDVVPLVNWFFETYGATMATHVTVEGSKKAAATVVKK